MGHCDENGVPLKDGDAVLGYNGLGAPTRYKRGVIDGLTAGPFGEATVRWDKGGQSSVFHYNLRKADRQPERLNG